MKKFFSLVLALVMALSLTTVAWGAATVVNNETELLNALNNGATEIELAADIKLTGELRNLDGVTLNGNGHTITVADSVVSDPTTWAMDELGDERRHLVELGSDCTIENVILDCKNLSYVVNVGGTDKTMRPASGVNAYRKTNVVLIDVTILNSPGAGLTVNGSDVTAVNLVTSGNNWGSVNVDPGSGVTEQSKFAVSGEGTNLAGGAAAIWSTGDKVTAGTNDVEIEISGGTYSGPITVADGKGSVEVTGGSFDTDVSEYVADGSALVQDTNGNWVAGAAVTRGDKFDLYLADSTMNTMLTLKTPKVADLSFNEVDAKTNKDGSGRVAYIAANNGQFFMKTSNPTVADYAVTYADKTDVLYYVTVAGTSAANFEYKETVNAFSNWGLKCGQFDNTKFTAAQRADDYFMASDFQVYRAGDAGTGTNYLLDGVVVSGTALGYTVDHNYVASNFKYDATTLTNVPTAALCTKCLETSTAIYKIGKAPANSTVKPLYIDGVKSTIWEVVPGVAPVVVPSTPSTDKVTSAETFDAGIAMYVGMSVMAAAGSAVVIGKKKEF